MNAHDDWERTGSGQLRRFVLGTTFIVQPEGKRYRWSMNLPGERTGLAATEDKAKEAAWNRYREYAFAQWLKGTLRPQRRILCPLE